MSIADKLTTIAENEQKVYNAGYTAGQEAGGGGSYDEGFTDGKQAEYDAFWDEYQQNGTRATYDFAFMGIGWTVNTLKPKYDIAPTSSATNIFRGNPITENLSDFFEKQGIKLDFSKATTLIEGFIYSATTGLGEIDLRNATSLSWAFGRATYLKSIKLLRLKNDGSQTVASMLAYCNALEDITIEGVIGQNGFTVQQSTKLSKSSWISIINALSTTTSGLSITGSLTSVKKAFETSEGANDGNTSAEWKALTDTKKNWTISLV